MVFFSDLLTPLQLKERFAVNSKQSAFIDKIRQEIRDILDGRDTRKLLIVGPCSIHDIPSALEYAHLLKNLSLEVQDQFLLVMRTYFEKPRTLLGWKGFLYDPYLDNSHNMAEGLVLVRSFLLQLADLQIPAATEFLDPISATYFDDLISWGCVGARTSTSQTHRQMASLLSMPIGFKNTTDGNTEAAINGILSSAQPHSFIGISSSGQVASVRTNGNPYGHLVLRGSESKTNYDPDSIASALSLLQNAGALESILVDCSHDNSKKDYMQQVRVFQSVVAQIIEGNHFVRGLLLESFIEAGKQQMTTPDQLKVAVSITDPCLDWVSTEALIRFGYEKLTNQNVEKISSVNPLNSLSC